MPFAWVARYKCFLVQHITFYCDLCCYTVSVGSFESCKRRELAAFKDSLAVSLTFWGQIRTHDHLGFFGDLEQI